jgi:hypothetical protein
MSQHFFEPSSQNRLACSFCGRPHGLHTEAVTNVSADKRVCELLGYVCVADFDLSVEALRPLEPRILAAIRKVRERSRSDLNIGLYAGGQDIRVWPVDHP